MASSDADRGPRRSAWLEIDLGAIVDNVAVIRDLVGPAVAVAPVVKADAYGHGLVAVGRALDGVVEALCVATLEEGLTLRDAGVRGRIILLYPILSPTLPEALDARLELTAMSIADVEDVVRVAGTQGGADRALVHIAVETGFFRGGIAPDAAAEIVLRLAGSDRVGIAGLWSHLADPVDAEASQRQVARFDGVAAAVVAGGADVPVRHLAASGSIFGGAGGPYEMVRPGISVYGHLDPMLTLSGPGRSAVSRLRPAMSLKARPIAISDVPSGGRVGYGGAWQADRPSRVATLPVGYADGFLRGSQPGAEALVRGRRLPIVGVVSMDSIGVDVTTVTDVRLDDEFVLIGEQGGERVTVSDLAHSRNTISWEVLSGMASRLDRVYHPVPGDAREGDRQRG